MKVVCTAWREIFPIFRDPPYNMGSKGQKISDSFLALIKRKRILEPLSRSCHVEVLQKKEPQNPIQFFIIDYLTWWLIVL
jgi:hypothetical protein